MSNFRKFSSQVPLNSLNNSSCGGFGVAPADTIIPVFIVLVMCKEDILALDVSWTIRDIHIQASQPVQHLPQVQMQQRLWLCQQPQGCWQVSHPPPPPPNILHEDGQSVIVVDAKIMDDADVCEVFEDLNLFFHGPRARGMGPGSVALNVKTKKCSASLHTDLTRRRWSRNCRR